MGFKVRNAFYHQQFYEQRRSTDCHLLKNPTSKDRKNKRYLIAKNKRNKKKANDVFGDVTQGTGELLCRHKKKEQPF